MITGTHAQSPTTTTTGCNAHLPLTDNDLGWLCEVLGSCGYKWKEIALGLGFSSSELCNIEAAPLLLHRAPFSWLRAVLSQWLHHAPGDCRGSRNCATTEGLKRALYLANLSRVAKTLHPPPP